MPEGCRLSLNGCALPGIQRREGDACAGACTRLLLVRRLANGCRMGSGGPWGSGFDGLECFPNFASELFVGPFTDHGIESLAEGHALGNVGED